MNYILLITGGILLGYGLGAPVRRFMVSRGHLTKASLEYVSPRVSAGQAAGEYDLHFTSTGDHQQLVRRAFRKDPSQVRAFLQQMLGPDVEVTERVVSEWLWPLSGGPKALLANARIMKWVAETPAAERVEMGPHSGPGEFSPVQSYQSARDEDPVHARQYALQLVRDGSPYALLAYQPGSKADGAALVDALCERIRSSGDAKVLNSLMSSTYSTLFSPLEACAVLKEVVAHVESPLGVRDPDERTLREVIQRLGKQLASVPTAQWRETLTQAPVHMRELLIQGILDSGGAAKLQEPGIWETISATGQRNILSQQLKHFPPITGAGSENSLLPVWQDLAQRGEQAPQSAERAVQALLSGSQAPAGILDATQNLPPGEFRNEAMRSLVSAWAGTDIVTASAAIAQLPPEQLTDQTVHALIQEIRNDPEAVAMWAQKLRSEADRVRITQEQISLLAQSDPAGAAQLQARLLPPAS